MKDDILGHVITFIEKHGSEVKPKFESISHLHPEYKFWLGRWELLTVCNGVLCIKWIEESATRLRICTPKVLRSIILWYLHDSPTSGHQGIQKTINRADMSSYYWPNFHRDITDYVNSCDICEEKKNPPRKKRHFMQSYVA